MFKPRWWNPFAQWIFRRERLKTFYRHSRKQVDRAFRYKRCVVHSCRSSFTDHNPEYGGGMCRHCWASWG